ncbi:hypothetical protein G9A89_008396 [Geosiphon pyriformis]|nr:hypothetical protein G9A89_008396 [Geosiphon pyriformis]
MANDSIQQNILIALQGIQTALGQKNNTLLSLFRNFSATWFLQKTNVGAYQRIIKWAPTNAKEKNIFFTIWFKTKFRTPILISKWYIELEKKTQDPGEVVIEYAKAIRKLIKRVNSEKNWTKKQKIHSFTKELRTDLSYAFWPLLVLKNNLTIDMAIELT